MQGRLRTCMFWLHWALGVVVGLAVVPMAITGSMLAFEHEITAWLERDRTVEPDGRTALVPSALVARATLDLPKDAKPTALLVRRATHEPVVLRTEHGTWLVDPYDGHVLGESSARAVFGLAEDVHRTLALTFAGKRDAGETLAGCVAIGIALLSLSGPWLWWPRKRTRTQFRQRLWFVRKDTTAARDHPWHHVIGIWCAPMLLVAGITGVLLCFDGARNAVTSVLGKATEAHEPHDSLGADEAVLEATRRAPDWTALRIFWPARKGRTTVRVQLATGTRPTHWATLGSSLPGHAPGEVTFTRYEDGRAGDKVLGWARWLHTGQALGWAGQVVWLAGALGLLVLVYSGLAMALRRARRWTLRRPAS